ncbi:MAG: transporter substrate-binding domain-containing protein, partial [Parasporobacterium sp.]|nr:transporter substrate-binding domain-containing protein [Parasporobacterium sp.]
MNRSKNKLKGSAIVCLLALAMCLLAGCGVKDNTEITSLDQLNGPGTKIGVPGDMLEYEMLQRDYPEAEVLVYDNYTMAYDDVAKGRLGAYVYARREMEFAIENGTAGVRLLDENYSKNTVAVGLSPVSPIPNFQGKINTFISELDADGTLDDMYMRWVILADDTMPEIVLPEHPAYHLRVGTTGTVMPYSYYVGTALRGYDIELAYRFAAWLGADIEFKIYDFGGIIAAAAVGDIDCIMSNLYVSPEKEDAIPFSDPLFDVEITAMVRSTDTRSETTDSDVRWQDYNSKRIGVLVGPLMEDAAAEFFPDSEYLYFDSYPDCATALLTGKIDGFLGDEPGMISMHAEQPEIDYIHEPLTENNYAFAFRKDDPESAALCEELDEFLSCAWEDGTMDEIAEIWLGVDEARKVVDMSDLTGENGTIRVATTSTDMPWSYIKDGKNVGYDIDLVVRFCRDRGYGLEIGDMDFAGRIPAVQSGKYDFTTDMNVTPEREEQVLFSDPTSQGGIVLAVRAADLDAPGSEDDAGVPTLADMEHASIAVLSGTTLPEVVERRLPDAEILYYNSTADVVNALKSGKADAVAIDEPVARNMMAEDDSLSMVSEKIDTIDYAFAFG